MAAHTAGPTRRFRSIQTKLLLALLLLSLLPLLLLLVSGRGGMLRLRAQLQAELVEDARASLVRLAADQAAIAGAMLSQVEVETRLLAQAVPALLAARAAGGESGGAPTWTLAPGVPLAAARAEAGQLGQLRDLFALAGQGDPNLDIVYFGTPSGLYSEVPWRLDEKDAYEFRLDASFARGLRPGAVSDSLRTTFAQNELTLSEQAAISSLVAGQIWLLTDEASRQIFSLRQGDAGLDVYLEFDPRLRPWYRGALEQPGVVWTQYDDWSRRDSLFRLDPAFEGQLGDKVTPALAQAFLAHQIVLEAGRAIDLDEIWGWRLQDVNGKHYKIQREDDSLQVFGIDVLTCSQAVRDPAGRLLGVVGLDIGMAAISRAIIHTPEDVEGYAFLLDGQGALVEQETAGAYVPPAAGEIRRQMVAGETGIHHDAAQAVYVAHAPLRTHRTAAQGASWSLGVAIPEREITRLADEIQRQLALVLALLAGLVVAMILLVAWVAFRISAGITGPIRTLGEGARRLGDGELEHRLDLPTGDEIEELAGTFNRMAAALETYMEDLRRTTAEKERFASELRVAREIQMSFLKHVFPPFPQRSEFTLFAALVPAKEVGGDLYDYALLDEDRLVFYVGDVSDKGVPAALVMAMTMTLMKRAWQQPGRTPAAVLADVNAALAEDNVNVMFVTLFLGILNLRTGQLSFSNAGHNPPLILESGGGCRYLELPDGLVLGVLAEAEYHDASVSLAPGDTIVVYTDGVTEAMSRERALYSEERLLATLGGLAGRSVEQTVDGIFADVHVHAAGAPPSDDIAVLALRRS